MEEFKGDKRTKEYREWKAKFEAKQEEKPQGLGDVVKKVTDATGISALVEFFTPEGKDCGCNERQESWNKKFPFNKVNCLTEDEFNWLTDFYGKVRITVSNEQKIKLYEIYNRVFNMKQKPSSCNSCVKRIVKSLKTILDSY